MRKWVPYPFVRMVLVFMAGIFTGIYKEELFLLVIRSFALFLFIYLILKYLAGKRKFPRYAISLGFSAMCLLFLLGFLHAYWYDETRYPDHIQQIEGEMSHYQALIASEPSATKNAYKAEVRLQKVKVREEWQKVRGRVLLYFSKTVSKVPASGDIILVKGKLSAIPEALNPEVFDYKEYLSLQNIFHRGFVKADNFLIIGQEESFNIYAIAQAMQRRGAEIFQKYIRDPSAQGIVVALVLGEKSHLENPLKIAYASAGVIHILAVSGLHVGIIYMIVHFLFSRFNGGRTKWLFACLVLATLWGYAMVTGLSPSVCRATTMFSIVVIAKTWRRQSNIYNTLAASAFVLLCFNPFWLMAVGFQLSYLAVLGIVYFYPRIYSLLYVKNYFFDKIWAVMAVSLSAQIGVLPLSIYYFNQFPVYFLLANIVMIPAAFIILSTGLSLLVMDLIPPVAAFIGNLLSGLVQILNGFVHLIQKFPLSVVDGLYLSQFQVAMSIGLILSLIALANTRKAAWAVFALLLLLAFQGDSVFQQRRYSEPRIIYSSIKNKGYLLLVDGAFQKLVHTGGKKLTKADYEYTLQPFLIKRTYNAGFGSLFFDPTSKSGLQKRNFEYGKLFVWNGQKLLVLNRPLPESWYFPDPLRVDLLIIENNAVKNPAAMPEGLHFNQLVIGNSCDFYTSQAWKKEVASKKYNLSYPRRDGAVIIDLN